MPVLCRVLLLVYTKRMQAFVGASLSKHHVYVLACVRACMRMCMPIWASLRMAEDMHAYNERGKLLL